MKKACVYFHQGWTDIINCLSLINYYNNLYDEIVVLCRSDASELMEFYTRDMPSVSVVYLQTDNGRFYGQFRKLKCPDVQYAAEGTGGTVDIPLDFDIMFHAEHDKYREDSYKGYWYGSSKKPTNHFVESFYTYYDIDYSIRVGSFGVTRDKRLEEETYDTFIKKHSSNYILYHDDEQNHQFGLHHVSTKIDFSKPIEGCTYFNLNKASNKLFDYIKILQNAKEIHLVDSVWAVLCWQLDAKYGLFSNKDIKVYCKRGHKEMFLEPVKLKNWEIIE